MPDDSPILKRVKSLLRLSASPNRNEAELALAKAVELANAHHISLREVDPTDEQARPTHTESKSWGKIPLEAEYAVIICKLHFHVRAIACREIDWNKMGYRWHYKLVGLPHDVAVAEYVFGFLVSHFRRSWNQRTNRRLRNRRNFLYGMLLGILTVLQSDQPDTPPAEDTSLVLSVDKYVADTIGETETSSHSLAKGDSAGTWAGFREGRKTQIHDALHASGKAPAALKG